MQKAVWENICEAEAFPAKPDSWTSVDGVSLFHLCIMYKNNRVSRLFKLLVNMKEKEVDHGESNQEKSEVNENRVQSISASGEERIYSWEFQSMESIFASFEKK